MTYGTMSGGYPPIFSFLHWLVAISVLTIIPVAYFMNRVAEGPLQNNLYNFHKSLGVLIFVLMILRLINRLAVAAPVPDPTLKRWERALLAAVHGLLYFLLLARPIVGYVANSAYGASTPFFGLFELPPLSPRMNRCPSSCSRCTAAPDGCWRSWRRCISPRRFSTTSSAATACCNGCCRARSAASNAQSPEYPRG